MSDPIQAGGRWQLYDYTEELLTLDAEHALATTAAAAALALLAELATDAPDTVQSQVQDIRDDLTRALERLGDPIETFRVLAEHAREGEDGDDKFLVAQPVNDEAD
jgi:hypothetical protein